MRQGARRLDGGRYVGRRGLVDSGPPPARVTDPSLQKWRFAQILWRCLGEACGFTLCGQCWISYPPGVKNFRDIRRWVVVLLPVCASSAARAQTLTNR